MNKLTERKAKKEFSLRTEMTGAEGKDLGVILFPTKQEDESILETNKETDSSTIE